MLSLEFVSFLLKHGIKLREAIVFGPAIRDEYDIDTPISLHIESDSDENSIRRLAEIFHRINSESWEKEGLKTGFRLHFGTPSAALRDEIRSSGTILYAPALSSGGISLLLFTLSFEALPRAKKLSAWRALYGYNQKVSGKQYSHEGIITSLGGEKIDKGVVLIPAERSGELAKELTERKITFTTRPLRGDAP